MTQRRDSGPPLKDRVYTTLYRLRYGEIYILYSVDMCIDLPPIARDIHDTFIDSLHK